jgi:dephospho-CoA kinase
VGLKKRKTSVLAVTGTIGSGKSAACQFLADRFSFVFLSADLICHSLLEKDSEGWKELIRQFGKGYLEKDGTIDRDRLRRDIFVSQDIRCRLEAFLHPMARREMQRSIALFSSQGKNVAAEVPLLYEAGWQSDFDRTVVVFASRSACVQRICQRAGISRKEAEKIIGTQMDIAKKIMKADHVIDNSGCWLETLLQLLRLGALYSQFPFSCGEKRLDSE